MENQSDSLKNQSWKGDVLRGLLALTVLLSFCFADRSILYWGGEAFGCPHVIAYWAFFTWLITAQVNRFRSAIRNMLVRRILNREFWLARWLEKKAFLRIVGVLIASMIALSMMSFVYTATMTILVLMALDNALFIILDRAVRINYSRIFQEDLASLMHEFTPVFLNVFILSAAFVAVTLLDTTRIFPLMSPELPNHVAETVHHSCRLFRWFIRTAHFLDLNVRSLRTIPESGWYLYLTMLLTSVSLVPFIGISMFYKSALGGMNNRRG